jgi:hypothetical protein
LNGSNLRFGCYSEDSVLFRIEYENRFQSFNILKWTSVLIAPYNFDVDEAEEDTQMGPTEVQCDSV